MVGSCANQLLAVADQLGLAHSDAVALGGAYYLALDGEASSEPPLSLEWEQRRRWPDWMAARTSRADIEFVRTRSFLSDLWHAELRGGGGSDGLAVQSAWLDPDLNVARSRAGEERAVPGFAELKSKWKRLRRQFGAQMGEVRREGLQPCLARTWAGVARRGQGTPTC